MLSFGGPAVTASIAYMDPGNFATNIQAGAGYGCELLWVALAACLVLRCSRRSRPRSGSPPGETSPNCAADIWHRLSSTPCGC